MLDDYKEKYDQSRGHMVVLKGRGGMWYMPTEWQNGKIRNRNATANKKYIYIKLICETLRVTEFHTACIMYMYCVYMQKMFVCVCIHWILSRKQFTQKFRLLNQMKYIIFTDIIAIEREIVRCDNERRLLKRSQLIKQTIGRLFTE